MKKVINFVKSMVLLIIFSSSTNFVVGQSSLCDQYSGQPANVIIPDGTSSSSLSTNNFNNVKISFKGYFIINSNISFTNCILEFVNEGRMSFSSQSSNLQMDMIGCKIYSCENTWSIQTFDSPNNHQVYVSGSHFQNFEAAFRLKGTNVGFFGCVFDGGVDYVHGTICLHNCKNGSGRSFSNNTFNQVEGGRAIWSGDGSVLNISNNNFYNGAEGITSEKSNLILMNNVFSRVGIGISSTKSNLEINKFPNQNSVNFIDCGTGIKSSRDNSLNVSNQLFKCTIDSDISNSTFVYYRGNTFLNPSVGNPLKTNIRCLATNLNLINNSFKNTSVESLGVDVNGGNVYAYKNTHINFSSYSPYEAYHVVLANTDFENNTINSGSLYFSNPTGGWYLNNTCINYSYYNTWTSQISPGSLYCNNTITAPYTIGMFFNGNNMNTILGKTTFGNCNIGLSINETIGIQDRRGNKWVGSYSNVGAAYTGADVSQSRFIAPNILPWTPSHTPSDFFKPTSYTAINSCEPILPIEVLLTDTDKKIIEGSDVWMKPVNEWVGKWYLYYKLYTNPSLLSDSGASTWYNAMKGSDVEAVAMMTYHIQEAYNYINETQVTNILDNLSALDTTTQWSVIQTYFSDLEQEISSSNHFRDQQLENALLYANTISRSNEFNSLVADVYIPYLTTLLDPNYVLTNYEKTLIENISRLCPEDYGFAVHAARHFTSTDDLYYLYQAQCNTLIDFRDIKEKTESNELSISPNPTTGVINVDKINGEDMFLFNQFGTLVYKVKVNNGQIDISDQNSGIYYLKAGQAIKKVILIK